MSGYTYTVLNVPPEAALHQTADHPESPQHGTHEGAATRWYRDSRNRLYARIETVDRFHPDGEVDWYHVTVTRNPKPGLSSRKEVNDGKETDD